MRETTATGIIALAAAGNGKGEQHMVMGIDCATKLTAKTAAAIRAEGYVFAGRYLVPNSGNLAWKALTRAEAETVTEAGLRLLTVWETTADRTRGGAAAGAVDGAGALKCAREIGMPAGGIIYFAVDYDAQPGDMDAIEAYLRAARKNTEEYEIGVYGPYSVIETMAQRKACTGFWQCVAWSYGRKSGYLNVYQTWFDQKAAGVSVDINECPDMNRAGIWSYKEDEDMKRYNTISELPEWAKPTIRKLIEMGAIRGSGASPDSDGNPTDMDLSYDMLRMFVINDRAGAYDK